jgi:phytoene desaturase
MKKAAVIGSGFAGLTAASLLAQRGVHVDVYEKNESAGGRARKFHADGFMFDMGPSWYWMPDVFQRYYGYFGHNTGDFYTLKLLDPGFRIFFESDTVDVPAQPRQLRELFEQLEPGAAKKLDKFFEEAKFKYEVGVHDIIYRQPDGIKPYLDWSVIYSASRLQMFKSIHTHIRQYFKHPILQQMLEFPVLFLGADPKNTPALYSMMAYAGYELGTWYPEGGMHEIVKAFLAINEKLGVNLHTDSEVTHVQGANGAVEFEVNGTTRVADAMVAACDYAHFDSHMVAPKYRQYSDKYWDSRDMAPTCLLYYLGVKGDIPKLLHHNLFFDADFLRHSEAIYGTKSWPEHPLFYVCCPSKTDKTVAPAGHENVFILIPLAAGLMETREKQEHYFQVVCERILARTGFDLRPNVVYRQDYGTSNFIADYHAHKGNAYGLANTLRQTAFLKPRMKHKYFKNVFMAGQLTVPGPGVPPSIVSGELAANYVHAYFAR